jgi:hypothetical protein
MKRSNRTRLPVPDELQHLIEKREGAERRAPKAKRSASQPLERRSGKDRRRNG